MIIKNDRFYIIVKEDNKGNITIFNNRVYLGRWVKSAYKQIKNREEYKIVKIINLLRYGEFIAC